jgi:hypothetical protein
MDGTPLDQETKACGCKQGIGHSDAKTECRVSRPFEAEPTQFLSQVMR